MNEKKLRILMCGVRGIAKSNLKVFDNNQSRDFRITNEVFFIKILNL